MRPCEPFRGARPLHRLVLRKIAGMIETAGLQVRAGRRNFGNGGLRQDLGRDVIDRRTRDLVNEADVLVLAGSHAGDNFPPGDFRIDNGLAPAPSIICLLYTSPSPRDS